MALSTTGYFTIGNSSAPPPGTVSAQGNYAPCAAPYATWNGATQYTNGTDFLAYLPTPGSPEWGVSSIVNSTYNSFYLLYYAATGASLTNMPLTGWVVNQGTAPAPTFAVWSPISTTGYQTIAPQPGTASAVGSYIPVTGVNATNQGAQQYFNGTNYLSFCTTPGGSEWQITTTLNAFYNSAGASYSVTTGANTTNMPLTGWAISSVSIAAPAPTFAAIPPPLSTTGYQTIAPQPGASGTNGSYIPVTGAGATLNGATQYTNGPYTLNYSPSGPNGAMWEIASSGSLIYYVVGTPTTMPLTGWTSAGAPTPYPTFAVIPPPLSTTGYQTIAPQPGTASAVGSYIPVTGVNATNQGAQQYFNGTNYLSFCITPGGPEWQITTTLNAAYNSAGQLYIASNSASTTNMPLTGWNFGTVFSNGAAPAPTFAATGGSSSISGIFSISGISSITF